MVALQRTISLIYENFSSSAVVFSTNQRAINTRLSNKDIFVFYNVASSVETYSSGDELCWFHVCKTDIVRNPLEHPPSICKHGHLLNDPHIYLFKFLIENVSIISNKFINTLKINEAGGFFKKAILINNLFLQLKKTHAKKNIEKTGWKTSRSRLKNKSVVRVKRVN